MDGMSFDGAVPSVINRRQLALLAVGATGWVATSASAAEVPAKAASDNPTDPLLGYDAPSSQNRPVARLGAGAAPELQQLASEWALSKVPHIYAQAIDRRDRATLAELFTKDAVFVMPGIVHPYDWILSIPEALQARYTKTYHAVFNQTINLEGDTASGELYCIAHHMYTDDGQDFSNDVRLRYQDRYRLGDDGRWRFTYRRVIIVAGIPRQPVTPRQR
jgi:ketosteroid isomerase-like protein